MIGLPRDMCIDPDQAQNDRFAFLLAYGARYNEYDTNTRV